MFIANFTHKCINKVCRIYLINTSVQKVNVLVYLADEPACGISFQALDIFVQCVSEDAHIVILTAE
jgi:glutaredoxin-related protein